MAKLIYTVLTNDYDDLKPVHNYSGFEYWVYTDNPSLSVKGWKTKVIPVAEDPHKQQRKIKILSHQIEGFDLTIYIDASFAVVNDPNQFLRQFYKGGFLCVKHQERNCITQEVQKVIELKKDDPDICRHQLSEYITYGIPMPSGLYQTGILVRDKSVKELELLWWSEVERKSVRDQISLPYAQWETKVPINVIARSQAYRFFKLFPHKKKSEMKIWYSNPYSTSKNFGKAINDFCSLVPNDEDWIVIQDGDICYLRPDWGVIVEKSLRMHGHKFGLIGCYTNSIGGLHQTLEGKRVTDKPMEYHLEKANQLNSYDIQDLEKYGVAGFLMAFQKKTWKLVGGFKENNRAFDTLFNRDVRSRGLKIGIMKGLYVYHLYRLWTKGEPQKELKHLE